MCPEALTSADSMDSFVKQCVFCIQHRVQSAGVIKVCISMCVCVLFHWTCWYTELLSEDLQSSEEAALHPLCVCAHVLCRYLLCHTNKARSHSRWRDLTISALTCKQVIFPSISLSLSLHLSLSPSLSEQANREQMSAGRPTKVNYSSPGDVVLNNAISF